VFSIKDVWKGWEWGLVQMRTTANGEGKDLADVHKVFSFIIPVCLSDVLYGWCPSINYLLLSNFLRFCHIIYLLGLTLIHIGLAPNVVCMTHICDTGAQNPSLVVFGFFLLNHILHCIYFKILFQNENVLFLSEVILVWLEQSKSEKNHIKSLRFLCPMQSSLHYSKTYSSQ